MLLPDLTRRKSRLRQFITWTLVILVIALIFGNFRRLLKLWVIQALFAYAFISVSLVPGSTQSLTRLSAGCDRMWTSGQV